MDEAKSASYFISLIYLLPSGFNRAFLLPFHVSYIVGGHRFNMKRITIGEITRVIRDTNTIPE